MDKTRREFLRQGLAAMAMPAVGGGIFSKRNAKAETQGTDWTIWINQEIIDPVAEPGPFTISANWNLLGVVVWKG